MPMQYGSSSQQDQSRLVSHVEDSETHKQASATWSQYSSSLAPTCVRAHSRHWCLQASSADKIS